MQCTQHFHFSNFHVCNQISEYLKKKLKTNLKVKLDNEVLIFYVLRWPSVKCNGQVWVLKWQFNILKGAFVHSQVINHQICLRHVSEVWHHTFCNYNLVIGLIPARPDHVGLESPWPVSTSWWSAGRRELSTDLLSLVLSLVVLPRDPPPGTVQPLVAIVQGWQI